MPDRDKTDRDKTDRDKTGRDETGRDKTGRDKKDRPTGPGGHRSAAAPPHRDGRTLRRRPKAVAEGAGPAGTAAEPMRIAKAMARAGLCSRREAERWIADGRVRVNGTLLTTPALDVGPRHKILVDGQPLPVAEPLRLWRYHKPRGLVTTHADPEGRPTVFDRLPDELPRVISIGRLDFNSEGLLLLTNDGELARHLELPATGWLRRYRVRAKGRVTQADLDRLEDGVEIEGVSYGPVEATLDTFQGANVWLTVGLREGKNREVRKILGSLGLEVGRLIRISFGPFQLLDLKEGAVELVKRRVLADQLGPKLAADFGLTGELEPEKPKRFRPLHPSKPKRQRTADDDVETRADRSARWRPGPPGVAPRPAKGPSGGGRRR